MTRQISANARALLDTIRLGEGTWHGGGEKGYGTMFGGGQFDWRQGHPDRVVRLNGYASAAAGAYQFMPGTWAGVNKQMGTDPKDFSPAAQDRAALQLVRNRGVNPDQPLDAAALNKLAPEWASLPTLSGKSYYGQPVKDRAGLLSFYSQRLQGGGERPAAAAEPPAAPAGSGGSAPSPPAVALDTGDGGGVATGIGSSPGAGAWAAFQQMNQAFQERHNALMAPAVPALPRNGRKAGQRLALLSDFFTEA